MSEELHARCYKASSSITFHTAMPENDEGLSWLKTKEEFRFKSARRGDMISSLFQCNCCWFVNINKKVANDIALNDVRLFAYIRRVNLDVMWSSEPCVLKATLLNLEKGKHISAELGLPPVEV